MSLINKDKDFSLGPRYCSVCALYNTMSCQQTYPFAFKGRDPAPLCFKEIDLTNYKAKGVLEMEIPRHCEECMLMNDLHDCTMQLDGDGGLIEWATYESQIANCPIKPYIGSDVNINKPELTPSKLIAHLMCHNHPTVKMSKKDLLDLYDKIVKVDSHE